MPEIAPGYSGHAETLGPGRPQRIWGRGEVGVRRIDGGTRLARLYQEGEAKLRLPKSYRDDVLDVVLINSGGGLTGGDNMTWRAEVGAGASLAITTQACEKIYRAEGASTATVRVELSVGDGGRLDWLPQETIVFDDAAFDRRVEADLARDSIFLALESFVLGRRASGESVRRASIQDHWRVRRDGVLIFADALRLQGDVTATAALDCCLGGAGAFASILLVCPDAEGAVAGLRAVLGRSGGASAHDGRLFCRIVVQNGQALRAILFSALGVLRPGLGLPRVWKI